MALPVYESESEWEALPEMEMEEEFESVGEASGEASGLHEINPARKIYLDAMMEHLGHAAAEAQSEQEAAEGFLPLIPMIASKLLPLAAKAVPMIAKSLPKVANVVSRVTPNLTRGVSQLTRGLFRNPRTRSLVRTVPSIARRTVTSIARRAATGQPVTPQAARRVLVQQARTVLRSPQVARATLRRSNALDRHYHTISRTPPPARISVFCNCGRPVPASRVNGCAARPTCRSCGQIVRA